MRSIFIFGWPGAGKTTSGRLIAARHGYTHYDLEKDRAEETPDECAFHSQWDSMLAGEPEPFFRTITSRPCVVTAGVNAEVFYVLVGLALCRLKTDAAMFWITGERQELRRRWIAKEQRNGRPFDPMAFDAQAERLRRHEATWRNVFAPNVLNATAEGMTTETVAEAVIATATHPAESSGSVVDR